MLLIEKVVFMLRLRSILLFFIILLFSPILFALAQQAEATPNLAQTFTSEDGSLSISYPDGWQVSALPPFKGVVDVSLASSKDALGRTIFFGMTKLQSGEASFHANIGSPVALIGEVLGIETTDDPVVFIQSYADHFNRFLKFDMTEAESITINDLPAARIDYHAKNRGEGYLLAIHLGDDELALIDVSAASDELANWESDIQAIIGSLLYTPKAITDQPAALNLTQHFVSSDDLFSFDYPEGWAIKAYTSASDGLDLSVATSPGDGTKDPVGDDNGKFAPGALRFQIVSGKRSTLFKNAKLTSDATVLDLLTSYLPTLAKTNGRFSAAEAVLVGDYPAASSEFTVPDRADGILLFVDMKDIIAVIVIYYAPGEAALWEPTLQDMLNSLSYTSG